MSITRYSSWRGLINGGSIQRVTEHLNLEFNVNHKFNEDNNDTLIMIASSMGRSSIVELLIMRGANVEDVNNFGMSALHAAANAGGDQGVQDSVNLLLQHKADINKQDINGETPLQFGVKSNNEKIVKLLLEHKADPTIPDKRGYPPLFSATSDNIKDMLRNAIDERKKFEGQQSAEDQASARRGPT